MDSRDGKALKLMGYKSRRYREPRTAVGTVAELFAGVGGFRIGLARAGWKTVFSNQWEPSTKVQHASRIYISQFGSEGHINEDISSILNLPRKIDLLVGGFPCQDYSVAKTLNTAKGLAGKKGVLWWEILRLVTLRKPRYILLENVDRLLKSPSTQRGRDFAVMLKTLGDEGYAIEWRVINAAEYGFPQRRIRVFIMATRIDYVHSDKQPHEIVAEKGILARAFPVTIERQTQNEVQLLESADVLSSQFNKGRGNSPFLNAGYYINGVAYTMKAAAIRPKKSMVLGDVLIDDSQVPEEYWVNGKRLNEWRYLKGAKSIERRHEASGTVYRYSEGKMAFPDLLTNPSRTILTGEGGTSPSRFKHLIKTRTGYRRLTPVELERLNGFPDGWTQYLDDGTKVSDARRAFMMGNALVIGLVELVGKVLAKEMGISIS